MHFLIKVFLVFLDNFISFDFFYWRSYFQSEIGELECSSAGEIRGHSFMKSKGKGEKGEWGGGGDVWRSQNFRQFCECLRMVLGEDGLTLLNVHRYMKQIFFSLISEDNLNFFPSQMFYWVLETCLICSPTINRNNKQNNFIRFGSSSVWLFSYHQCFYTYETFGHYVPIVKVFLSHCWSFLSNCDSLYVRLNSHYKAWSYKKKKDKKIKAYSKSL